jgi:hypothetical protein
MTCVGCRRGNFTITKGLCIMPSSADLPIYDPGNAPDIHFLTLGDIEFANGMAIIQLCIPRTVGGERVRYVTAYLVTAADAIPGNIAATELALAKRERGSAMLAS